MSVKLKPDYAKAYSRLGAALTSLRKHRQAADNGYAHAMRLDPANSECVFSSLSITTAFPL